MTPETHARSVVELHRLATEAVAKMMDKHGLDIVISASDANLVSFSACARWPIGSVPLGNLSKNGQPYGWFAMARWGREDVLLRFMMACYQTFPGIAHPTSVF